MSSEELAGQLSRQLGRQLGGVRVETIGFAVHPGQPLWVPTYSESEERPAGSPLAPGEEVWMEGEDQGKEIWVVSRLDGGRALNTAHYSGTCLRLSCGTGHAEALAALSEFMNASWLQDLDDPGFLTALAEMPPGNGVNLRDQGQALRESDGQWVQVWAGESYFDGSPAQARIRMAELSKITALCLRFWHLRQRFLTAFGAMMQEDQHPPDDELPRYEAGRGFVNAERWS